MRSSKSRSRGKSNRNRSVGNIVNRVFDSSGPEGKVRGTPQQIIDKYNQLARDAQLSNDRVAAENFQQHAEHYLRLLAEAQREQQERQAQQQQQQQRRQDEQGGRDGGTARVPDKRIEQGESNSRPDEVIEVQAASEPSGLVETPEENARTQRRPRRKKPDENAPDTGSAAEKVNEDAAPPDAAE